MDVLTGAGYAITVRGLWDLMLQPLLWTAELWVATTFVRAVQARQAQSERYWGI